MLGGEEGMDLMLRVFRNEGWASSINLDLELFGNAR